MAQGGAGGGSSSGRVSIVVPAYNTERYVGECLDSALDQTYRDVEVVAVDDGSTDGTPDVLAGYADRVRVVTTANRGVAPACNRGVKASSGAWIKFLGSDDMLEPDAVERLVGAAMSLPGPSRAVPFGDMVVVGRDGRAIDAPDPYPHGSLGAIEQGGILLEDMYAPPARQIIRRADLDRVGLFDERYGVAEDIEFNLRLVVVHGYRLHHVPGVVYRYRMGREGQLSGRLREYGEAHKRAAREALASLDEGRRRRYEEAAGRYRREKWFRLGMWYYANPDLASAGRAGGVRAPGRASLRSPLARAAYRAAKTGSMRPLAGWWWARRHPRHADVEKMRGRPLSMVMAN